MSKELTDLTLHLHAETEKAIRVSDDGIDKHAVWLLLSQCEVTPHAHYANTVEVTCPVWLAQQKGLI